MAQNKNTANTFHEMFEETLSKAYSKKMDDLLVEMLTKKFSDDGVRVGKKTIRRLAEQLREGETNIEFDNRRKSNIEITINDKEIKEVRAEFNRWTKRNQPKIYKGLHQSIDETAEHILKTTKRRMPEQIKAIQSDRVRTESRIQRIWKKPFELLELYITYVEELTIDCYNEQMESNEPEDVVFEVLFKLQARAIQIAKEILVLIQSGFADGAHARWRSLHELSVVAMFIEKHGEPVAVRYLAHDAVEYCKGAEQFQTYAKSLKQKVIPKREMTRIRQQRDDAIATYGDNFKYEYGWAANALNPTNPKYKPNFVDLELDVKQDKWRPYYRKASWNIHAGASGIASKLGLLDEHQMDLVLIGASEYGFTDPAHGTAISLMKSTSAILSYNQQANIDRQVRAMVLLKLSTIIGDEFFRVQQQYEPQ